MGNQPPVVNRNNGPFRRPNGTLGLTRSELDERCKPSGLYQDCAWDERTIRRLIGDGKLAARLTGKECRQDGTEQECPICFLYYDEINMLKCCKAKICTECYLQLQNPRERSAPCPFCNKPNMSVEVAEQLNQSDAAKRDEEEQRVIEATIRARANSESQTACSDGSSGTRENFGTRLNEELKRSRRLSSADLDTDEALTIDNMTMTVDERRELENKMKSQLSHPLMREMQRNAEMESQRHMMEHAERRRDHVRNSRDSLERFIERARIREHGLNLFSGAIRHDEDGRPSMDDLYLLEAALFLSAREDSMRRRRNDGSRTGLRHRNRDSAFLQALISGRRGGRDIDELLHAARRGADNNSDGNDDDGGESNDDQGRFNRFGLSPADIMLAGLSEDSQIEMAIQMSLREAEQQEQEQEQQENQEENENDDTGVDGTTSNENNGEVQNSVIVDVSTNTDDSNEETQSSDNVGDESTNTDDNNGETQNSAESAQAQSAD